MGIDMARVKPGDTLTLVHSDGSRLVRDVVRHDPKVEDDRFVELVTGGAMAGNYFVYLPWLVDNGAWSIVEHKSVVPPPTEPGVYTTDPGRPSATLYVLNADSIIWETDADGSWFVVGECELPANLTRLMPREETAREVIAWIEEHHGISSILTEVRIHFGVHDS